MKQLKVGIIGQGRSGRDIHGKYLINDGTRFKIAAVADLLEDRRNRARAEYGCDTYEDYRQMFARKDLDIIINATPSNLHVPVSLEFIRNGFNVLCEKPLARRESDVDLLAGEVKKSGKVFMVFQQSRFAPYFQKVREIIDSGVLGRIIQISIVYSGFSRRWDWQAIQECDGGSLLNTGPHPLDQALQFMGPGPMPDITCFMDYVNTSGDAEDYVKLILHSPGRPVIDMEVSACCAYPCYTYNVQGSAGGMKGSMDHMEWKYFVPEEAPARRLIREPLANDDGTPSYCVEQLKWYEGSWDVPGDQKNLFFYTAKCYYSMLYDCIVCGKEPEVTLEQVRRQVGVIEECHRRYPSKGAGG